MHHLAAKDRFAGESFARGDLRTNFGCDTNSGKTNHVFRSAESDGGATRGGDF
jgi:hypothetical protein